MVAGRGYLPRQENGLPEARFQRLVIACDQREVMAFLIGDLRHADVGPLAGLLNDPQ